MMHQAQTYLDENAKLRNAVEALEEDVLTLHSLGVGEHNVNYWFDVPSSGIRFVLRVNLVAQPFHSDQVVYEFHALETLAPCGCAPKPVFADSSPSAPGNGAMVIGFCEGEQLDFDHLRPGDLRCAAQLMANVHAVEVPDGCRLHRPRDPLLELFGECIERFRIYRSSGCEDPRITKWAERFIRAAQPALECAPPSTTRLHVINTETLPSHFLIPTCSASTAAGAASSGTGPFCESPGFFIDWERPILGEVAQDVAYFVSPTTTFWDSEYLFASDKVDSFVEDYWRAVDGRFERDGFDERFRAYRMMTALRSVTWCCRALVHYRQSGTHKTPKTERKLPICLSDEFMSLVAEECFGL